MNRLSIWTPERHAKLVSLFEEKMSIAKICQIMGLTKGQVIGRLGRCGLNYGTKHWCAWCGATLRRSQFCDDACAEAYRKDLEREQLARKMADQVVELRR